MILFYRELSATFARLCQLVDEIVSDIKTELKQLDDQIENLESCSNNSKNLQDKAKYLSNELDKFTNQYLNFKNN